MSGCCMLELSHRHKLHTALETAEIDTNQKEIFSKNNSQWPIKKTVASVEFHLPTQEDEDDKQG